MGPVVARGFEAGCYSSAHWGPIWNAGVAGTNLSVCVCVCVLGRGSLSSRGTMHVAGSS